MTNTGLPKSKSEKKRNGTYRKSMDVAISVTGEVLTDVPEMIFRDEVATQYYKKICRILLQNGWLLEDFLNDIVRAAEWHAMYEEHKNNSMLITMKTGYQQISASFTIIKEAQKNLVDFENRYGLNLLSSQRFEKKRPESDPFEKLLSGN